MKKRLPKETPKHLRNHRRCMQINSILFPRKIRKSFVFWYFLNRIELIYLNLLKSQSKCGNDQLVFGEKQMLIIKRKKNNKLKYALHQWKVCLTFPVAKSFLHLMVQCWLFYLSVKSIYITNTPWCIESDNLKTTRTIRYLPIHFYKTLWLIILHYLFKELYLQNWDLR